MEVLNRHTVDLMSRAGVVGTATGLTEGGQFAILVLTEHALGKGVLPETIDGRAVISPRARSGAGAVPGVYEGQTSDGAPCIRIMLVKRAREPEAKLPRSLGGCPVELEETGEIRPLDTK